MHVCPLLLRLLIHILSINPRPPISRRSISLLVRKVPAVQVSRAGAQIRGKPQPAQIRRQTPRSDGVDAGPDVGQVGRRAGQGDDVGRGLDGPLEAEEEGHPDEVEAELDGEEGRALLIERETNQSQSVNRWLWSWDWDWEREGGGSYFSQRDDVGVQRRHARIPGSVGGVSHEAVQDRPDGTEDLRRRSVGRLLERHVRLLGFFGCQAS